MWRSTRRIDGRSEYRSVFFSLKIHPWKEIFQAVTSLSLIVYFSGMLYNVLVVMIRPTIFCRKFNVVLQYRFIFCSLVFLVARQSLTNYWLYILFAKLLSDYDSGAIVKCDHRVVCKVPLSIHSIILISHQKFRKFMSRDYVIRDICTSPHNKLFHGTIERLASRQKRTFETATSSS